VPAEGHDGAADRLSVRVRGDGLERLADVIGVGASREAIAAATGPDELGWTTLFLRLEDLWHAEA
jgi:hypothetical protein